MIVYRSPERWLEVGPVLDRVIASLRSPAPGGESGHEYLLELLIEFGELESAVADRLSPDSDAHTPLTAAFREVSIALAMAMDGAGRGGAPPGSGAPLGAALAMLDGEARGELPSRMCVAVPEGYAYYGVYPECYRMAARRYLDERRPASAVCLGLRSIGVSLSAAVAGVLRSDGCEVESYTLRPRGHPFDRHVRLSPALRDALMRRAGAAFLIIDEGPGISGSSMAAAADALSALGVPDDRILLLPSWDAPPEALRSERARGRWTRHRRYVATFEEVAMGGLRGAAGEAGGPLRDIGGGRWRALSYADEACWPAVQPQHERRKYLCRENGAASDEATLLRFAGLGHYGRRTRERAEALAAGGFGPPVLGLASGFLHLRFVEGWPVARGEADDALLDAMADYLAFVRGSFPGTRAAPLDADLEMMRVNVGEGLGARALAGVERLAADADVLRDAPTIALDGRMLPHEWLRTAGGYIKCDGADHHDDHFFPGHQDIAWDLAGCCLEMDLAPGQQERLIRRYRRDRRDAALERRLPFYRAAYLSYRLGYCALGAEVLGGAADGLRLAAERERYAALLRRELAGGA